MMQLAVHPNRYPDVRLRQFHPREPNRRILEGGGGMSKVYAPADSIFADRPTELDDLLKVTVDELWRLQRDEVATYWMLFTCLFERLPVSAGVAVVQARADDLLHVPVRHRRGNRPQHGLPLPGPDEFVVQVNPARRRTGVVFHSLSQPHWVDIDHQIRTKRTPCREVSEEEAAWGSGGLFQRHRESPLKAVACERQKPLDCCNRSR